MYVCMYLNVSTYTTKYEIDVLYDRSMNIRVHEQRYEHTYVHPTYFSVPYFLDQTPPSNSHHTQIVAASFPYLSFIVATLELLPHILIRAHLQKKKVEEEHSSQDT